jgi:hypothetical protein
MALIIILIVLFAYGGIDQVNNKRSWKKYEEESEQRRKREGLL